MSSDLIIPEGRALDNVFANEEVWRCDPMGHSPYQLRNFVIKQGNPNADTQKKQAIRELWSRRGALRQALHAVATNEARIEILEGEIVDVSRKFWWSRRKRHGEILHRRAEIKNLQLGIDDLNSDIRHRIVRETPVLLKEFSLMPHSSRDRDTAEQENWELRAEQGQNKELQQLLEGKK